MVKKVMKNSVGEATKFISRAKAIKKLQVTLKDFRRLCILKGVYPREPPKKLQRTNKTYYHNKDINFLMHEKILDKFRAMKTHLKKAARLRARGETTKLRLLKKQKPQYSLNHLVKERYPSFIDALRDLDDPLCLINLFASFPAHRALGVPRERITACIKLMREFNLFVIKNKCLRKVFISIKGIYYQAEIEGQKLTWIAPFQLPADLPAEVDYKVMLTFLEFYETLVRFVNFKLFNSIGIKYPLEVNQSIEDTSYFSYSSFILKNKDSSESIAQAEQENEKYAIDDKFKKDSNVQQMTTDSSSNLFKNCVFFLSSEVPRLSVEFIALAFSAQVHWAGDESEINWDSNTITHFVTDRDPKTLQIIKNREYVQPQWVYDSINAAQLLPVGEYAPGKSLPPHLSPFIEYSETEYKPERQKQIEKLQGLEQEEEDEDEEVEIDEDEDEEEELEGEDDLEIDEEELGSDEEDDEDAEIDEEDDEEEEESDDDEEDEEEEDNGEESDVEDMKKVDEEEENEYDHDKEQQKKVKSQIKDQKEQKELAKAVMSRKNKKLYDIMQKSKADKVSKVTNLKNKAAQIKQKQKKQQSK